MWIFLEKNPLIIRGFCLHHFRKCYSRRIGREQSQLRRCPFGHINEMIFIVG